MGSTKKLIKRLNHLLDRLEPLLGPVGGESDWSFEAYRWHKGQLQGVADPHRIELDDLLGIDRQKAEVLRNTAHFVAGQPANHVLLWGARGTGKSSLVKAVFHAFADEGLRLIEIEPAELHDLPELIGLLRDRPERFILYCDDLSFEANDPSYKTLKALLEGSIIAPPPNMLLYATSNRRHLMPEFQAENRETGYLGDEIHPGESIEEKVSLSERFDLWLSFYPFDQEQYLAICVHWIVRLGGEVTDAAWREAALRWATQRGSRSGRVARQFAVDWLARGGLASDFTS